MSFKRGSSKTHIRAHTHTLSPSLSLSIFVRQQRLPLAPSPHSNTQKGRRDPHHQYM
eukprot:EC715175.1.p4 GENE.EC715175.1~~EC715175.1.p4  ORF type:complete len:57 (-),score=7.24 EC715175.1:169-339(-)